MDKQQKFLICEHCGNLVGVINNSGVDMYCCGQPMTALVANTTDAAVEKHVPVVTVEGDVVKVVVGDTIHPMEEKHLIQWIYVQTNKGGQRKALVAGEKPEAEFVMKDETPIAVFAYCNLHGLWKKDL